MVLNSSLIQYPWFIQVLLVLMTQNSKRNTHCQVSTRYKCIALIIPGFHKTEEKRSSYPVGTSKKNTGTNIARWRGCQFQIVKARPANIICPTAPAHNNRAVAKAWNLGLVHSITGRKENES